MFLSEWADSVICWGRELWLVAFWRSCEVSTRLHQRMKCFINWFARFPPRPLSTLASITFLFVCVCVSARHFVGIVFPSNVLHINQLAACTDMPTHTHEHTQTHLIIKSIGLKSLVLFFGRHVTKINGFSRKLHPTVAVFVLIWDSLSEIQRLQAVALEADDVLGGH